MINAFNRRDAALKQTKALPAAAGAVNTDAIDTQKSSNGHMLAECELEITAPALATEQLADGDTVVYDVIHSDSADLSGAVVLAGALITQTGAAAAGAAGATTRYRLPTNCKRYIGLQSTTDGDGDASAAEMVLDLLF